MRQQITLKFRPGEYEHLYRAAKIREMTMPRFMNHAAHCLATLILEDLPTLEALELRMCRDAVSRINRPRKEERI